MTLNGEMALILHYFTEFLYDVVVKQLLVLPRFKNIERTSLDPISDPGRGAIGPEPATSGTGCCPGAGPFSPVGTVGGSAQRVGVEGWTPESGLVSDRDLALARGRKL